MKVLALMAAAAMAAPGHGAAPAGTTAHVDMPGRFFSPEALQVLAGDTVTWRNSDHAVHSVSAREHSFASERLSPGDEFSFTFTEPGSYDYYCAIHRDMRGTVQVAALGLTGPEETLSPQDIASLDVLAPEHTPSVVLERRAGDAFEPVAEAAPDHAGRASFHVPVTGPVVYRARAGELSSAELPLQVAPHVTATAERRGRRITVRARLDPPLPGASVALKRYARWRFAYETVRTRRLADGGQVTFRLRRAGRVALRVGVVQAPGGWAPVDSHLVTVPSHRP